MYDILLYTTIQLNRIQINSSENSNPKPQLDDGEFVETVILPMYNLLDHIEGINLTFKILL